MMTIRGACADIFWFSLFRAALATVETLARAEGGTSPAGAAHEA